MDSSPAARARIRERAEKLDMLHPRIMSCRVVVRAPHRRHVQGKLYNVRIDLKVPGNEIAVNRDPADHHAHSNLYVAIRDAFDALERRLEDIARRKRGDVKAHAGKNEIRLTARTVRPAPRPQAKKARAKA